MAFDAEADPSVPARWWVRLRGWFSSGPSVPDGSTRVTPPQQGLAELEAASSLGGLGHWCIDAATRRLRVGARARWLLGLPAEPAAALTLDHLLTPLDDAARMALRDAIAQACDGGPGLDLDLPCAPADDGEPRHLRWMVEPRRELGRLVRLDGAVQDVTRQVRTRLAQQEQHHVAMQVLSNTTQGVWWVDIDGRTRDLNPAMCQLLGRRREEVLGRRATEFFDGEALRTLRGQLEQRQRGVSGSYELDLERPDGSRRRCRNTATPVYDLLGRRLGSIGMWTDLTEIRSAEQALRLYEVAANSITDLVSVVSDDLVYHLVNDAWCKATGLAREDALGLHVRDVPRPSRMEDRVQALVDCARTRQVQCLRSRLTLPGLPDRVVETTYYPYAAEIAGHRCVVVVSRDVTASDDARLHIEEAAEHLRATLDATSDAIFASDAADPRQPVRFANDAMLRLWGLQASEARPLTPERIMSAAIPMFSDPQAQTARVMSLIADGQSAEDMVPLRDGRLLQRRFVASKVHGRSLRVWSFRDITAEHRALHDAQQRGAEQRALLDAFPGYIARLNVQGRYTYVNRRLAELLGQHPEQMLGRHVSEIVGEERARLVVGSLHRCLAGESVSLERVAPALAGRSERFEQITLAAGVDPASGAPAVFAFGIDITDQKRAQTALREAKEAAERANQAKSTFLSHLSHELRTPLNAVLGFAQLLQTDTAMPLAVPHRAQMDHIVGAGRHLLALLDDLLDMARIDAGRLQVQLAEVALPELLEECLTLLRPLAAQHGVRLPEALRGDASVRVRADRTRLRQVLVNLLSNAVKYNRRGGQVELRWRAGEHQVSIAVRDTGRGLSAEQIQRLFRPFERLDAQHGPIEGTGIGLALSKGLVDAMGGQLEVDSVPDVGSTFSVRLQRLRDGSQAVATPLPAQPGAEVPPALPGPALAGPRAAHGLSVLHVDDNAVNQLLMDAMLRKLPQVDVVHVGDAEAALQIAAKLCPVLILSDIHLPGSDGFELLRRLRANAATRSIPVVAVSADATARDIAAARAAGFDDYLCKPLHLDSLLATVQRLLPAAAGATPRDERGD